MEDNRIHFYFFAYAALGKGLSGSDRIYIELAKRWGKKYPIDIFVWDEGYKMAKREQLQAHKIVFHNTQMKPWRYFGMGINYLARIVKSIITGFTVKLENARETILYSASDFWMDTLPAYILKKRYPKVTWVGSFYLTAPNPFRGFREKGKFILPSLKGIIYYFLQQPIYQLLHMKADIIFVTSEPDINRFEKHKKNNQYYVVRGGVNLEPIEELRKNFSHLPHIYDAVFMGRFHPQKGVLELIDIWKKVVEKIPYAKLIMIGDGPLMDEVKTKIRRYKLTNNIKLKGYVFDGTEKYKIFSQSRIFLHPAIYDSGGMAAAEGMAWKLPGISFDLKALRTYYPKGILKVPLYDKDIFVKTIIKLLHDKKLYEKVSSDAYDLIFKYWDWNKRTDDILAFLIHRKKFNSTT